ncbi:MAG: hypothetical protein Q9221_001042 [Calogaya cf. arnoldii]
MTVTYEEFETIGISREYLLTRWESENKRLQPWRFNTHFSLNSETLPQWWPLKDIHKFCLKLCVIYATVDIAFPWELAEYLWAKWFRPEIPCRFENFFARFVGCYSPDSPKMISELLDAHRYICAQVLLRQVILHPADNKFNEHTIDGRAEDPYENHENYVLEALFHALFIVIDTIPPLNNFRTRARDDREFVAATPVLIVRTSDYHDLKTGPIDFGPIESLSEEVDGNADVRRINLGDAVDFILDLQRRNSDFPS